jgi:hypothetical protein
VFRLRTTSGMNAQGRSVSQSMPSFGLNLVAGADAHAGHAHMQALNVTPLNTLSSSATSAPFDNYAAAKVGDLARLLTGIILPWCARPRWRTCRHSRLASSPSPQPDLRGRHARAERRRLLHGVQAARDKFTKAGEIADRHMLPALRAVINPQLALPSDGQDDEHPAAHAREGVDGRGP